MEVAMELRGSFYETAHSSVNSASICAELLRDEIFLPKKTLKIYAIFTEKKVPDAFRIKPPNHSCTSVIAGVRPYMFSWTRKTLATAYKKGFRYVRIEYDE